jgi:hypothetical protein
MLLACAAAACAACGGASAFKAPRADTLLPAGGAPALPMSHAAGSPLTEDEDALNRRPLKLPLADPKIVVEKRARRLKLYAGGELARVRRVVLGFAPVGDKEKQATGARPRASSMSA